MGTDRAEIFRAPCPCAKGHVVAEWCELDNPWSRGGWYETTIACDDCEKEYALENRGPNEDQVVLVRKADQAARKLLSSEVSDRTRALIAGRAQPALDAFARLLGEQPSVAAIHRAIRETDPAFYETEQTFRRRWKKERSTPASWIKANVYSVGRVAKIMKRVGMPDPEIEAEIAAIEAIAGRAAVPCPSVALAIPSLRAAMRHEA